MSFVCDSNSNHHVSLDSQQRLSSTAPIIATTMLSSSGSVACDLQQCSTASHVHVSPLQKLSIDLFKTYKQINEVRLRQTLNKLINYTFLHLMLKSRSVLLDHV